jgi:CBS domain-containing protein
VYRYAAGKVDWLASGLPSEGEQAAEPRIASLAIADVPVCRPGERLGQVRARLDEAERDLCVVVDEQHVVLGSLRGHALDGAAETPVDEVMDPGPSTYRPNTSVREMAEQLGQSKARRVLVTTADGVLLGVLRREDVEHAAHAGGPNLANHTQPEKEGA